VYLGMVLLVKLTNVGLAVNGGIWVEVGGFGKVGIGMKGGIWWGGRWRIW
jgi:hypothetical protein